VTPAGMLVEVSGSCLILDFDGTILDTEEPIYLSWAELWEQQGHTLPLEQWQTVIGTIDGFDPLGELERRVGHPLDVDLLGRRRARRDELQAERELRPGIMSWLQQAEELGLPVGIASSSPPGWVEGHLDRLGLRDRFSSLVCCDGTIPAKPDPTSYRTACRRLGAEPSMSVAVEDSPHGVGAAVAAGLFTVAVPHTLTADLDMSAADVVADSLEELLLAELVERARRRGDHQGVL
jgi:HAD superfamily hydrolase (TIGR01509 family)